MAEYSDLYKLADAYYILGDIQKSMSIFDKIKLLENSFDYESITVEEKYCCAPWVEGVLFANGASYPCTRNYISLGNWKNTCISDIWKSQEYVDFRRTILEGKFPNKACMTCYYTKQATNLEQELHESLLSNCNKVKDIPDIHSAAIKLFPLLRTDKMDLNAHESMTAFFVAIERGLKNSNDELHGAALEKLFKIGRAVWSFLNSDLVPSVVMPCRQVHMLSSCNANCVHCSIRYIPPFVESKVMPDDMVHMAFDNSEDIVSYYMQGSEFLLYNSWKSLYEKLNSRGVTISGSTNGILLTRENIEFIAEKMNCLNISIDGASESVVERIRLNVSFNRLIDSVSYLIEYANTIPTNLHLSFSFVLMKSNYKEFPDLVRLIGKLKGARTKPFINIFCQPLYKLSDLAPQYNYDKSITGYMHFYINEHHSNVSKDELNEMYKDALRASLDTGIPVGMFCKYTIEDYISLGCPPIES